jgi:MYXO-CTERM domain-containing protein
MVESNSGGTLRNNGIYTAGPDPYTQDTVEVSDELNRTATGTLTVGPGVSATFAGIVHPHQTVHLTAAGGSGDGYQWMLTSSQSGATLELDGTFTAGAQTGSDVVTVSDPLGNSATQDITVAEGAELTITGGGSVSTGGQLHLSVSGGSGAGYTWSLTAATSGGSITQSGLYTAGRTGGVTDTVLVVDSAQNTASLDIQVIQGSTGGSGGDVARRGCGCNGEGPLALPALAFLVLVRLRRRERAAL